MLPFGQFFANNVYGDETMNGKNIFYRVRFAICILLLQTNLTLLLSGCAGASCHLQAVAGGASLCKEP